MVSGYSIAIDCATVVLWIGVDLLLAMMPELGGGRMVQVFEGGDRFTRQEEIRTENTTTGHSKEMRSPANLELGLGQSGARAGKLPVRLRAVQCVEWVGWRDRCDVFGPNGQGLTGGLLLFCWFSRSFVREGPDARVCKSATSLPVA